MALTPEEVLKQFQETVRKMDDVQDVFKKASEAIIDAAVTHATGGSGGGGGSRTPGTSGGGEDHERKGFFRRAFDRSRIGRSVEEYKRYFYGDDYEKGSSKGRAGKEPTGKGGAPGSRAAAGGAKAGGGLGSKASLGLKAAGVIGGVVGVVQALNDLRKAIVDTTTAQLAQAKHLAELNGDLAQVFATKEIRDFQREIRLSRLVSGSVGKLADSEARRKDATLPVEAAIDNATNRILAAANGWIADIAEEIVRIGNEFGDKWLGKKLFPGDGPAGAGTLFDAINGPGGALDEAKKIEADALAKLRALRNRGHAPAGALPPRRLP